MKNTSTHLLLGTMSLLAANSPLPMSHASTHPVSEQKMEALNAASLKSIESSWLEVPPVCKARFFNEDATQQMHKEARAHIQAIYASYEA